MTATTRKARPHPVLVSLAMRSARGGSEGLRFRPEPPGDRGRLELPVVEIEVRAEASELDTLVEGLANGVLSRDDVQAVLDEARFEYGVSCPPDLQSRLTLLGGHRPSDDGDRFADVTECHQARSRQPRFRGRDDERDRD